jgi:chromosome segregation ATPase
MADQLDSIAEQGTVITAPTNTTWQANNASTLTGGAVGRVKGTMQELAAAKREHNCDICAGVNKDIAVAKAEIMLFVGELRTTIEGLFAGTSSNPAVEDIKQQISAVKAKVKAIKKEIEPIQEQIEAIQAYIKEMQELIAYIQSLPSELQALLQACLSEATAGITQAINEIKSTPGAIINEVKSTAQETINTVKDIEAAVNEIPAAATDVVVSVTPTTPEA